MKHIFANEDNNEKVANVIVLCMDSARVHQNNLSKHLKGHSELKAKSPESFSWNILDMIQEILLSFYTHRAILACVNTTIWLQDSNVCVIPDGQMCHFDMTAWCHMDRIIRLGWPRGGERKSVSLDNFHLIQQLLERRLTDLVAQIHKHKREER